MRDSARAYTFALPADSDGFLRRECPSCRRQFKVKAVDTFSAVLSERAALDEYELSGGMTGHCPLCHEMVVRGDWRTDAQRRYIPNIRMDGTAHLYASQLLSASKGSRALIELAGFPPGAALETPVDTNDMDIVLPLCHESYPLKVPSDWCEDLSCFMCGARFSFPAIHG